MPTLRSWDKGRGTAGGADLKRCPCHAARWNTPPNCAKCAFCTRDALVIAFPTFARARRRRLPPTSPEGSSQGRLHSNRTARTPRHRRRNRGASAPSTRSKVERGWESAQTRATPRADARRRRAARRSQMSDDYSFPAPTCRRTHAGAVAGRWSSGFQRSELFLQGGLTNATGCDIMGLPDSQESGNCSIDRDVLAGDEGVSSS